MPGKHKIEAKELRLWKLEQKLTKYLSAEFYSDFYFNVRFLLF